MSYIFPEKAIAELFKLRRTYETEKGVDSTAKPSAIGMPIALGGTDIEARNKQLAFLEKILNILGPYLKKFDRDISNDDLMGKLEDRHNAYKLCLVACWYIQKQTETMRNGSKLRQIIDKCLEVTKENNYDASDKTECFLAANRFINTNGILTQSNVRLNKAGLPRFSESEWKQFSDFIKANQPQNKEALAADQYPITSLTKPLFGAAFANVGLTMGFLSGGVISQSSKAMSAKLKLTALIGGSVFLMGPSGPTGLALFAPVIATKVFSGLCSITLAKIMSSSMELVGNGVGTAVGMSLDLSCRLLKSFCSIVGGYIAPTADSSQVTGMRISDGALMFHGIPFSFVPEAALKTTKLKQIEFKEDGSILIDGKPLLNEKGQFMLSADIKQKLKDQYTQDIEEVIGGKAAGSKVVIEAEPSALSVASPA